MSRGPENGCPRGSLSPLHSNRRQISSLFPLSFFTLLPRLRRCVCVALKGALSKPGHSYHYLSLSHSLRSPRVHCVLWTVLHLQKHFRGYSKEPPSLLLFLSRASDNNSVLATTTTQLPPLLLFGGLPPPSPPSFPHPPDSIWPELVKDLDKQHEAASASHSIADT